MPYLSGEVVYNFRCSLFHQGNPNLDEIEYEKRKKKKCPIDKFVVVVEKEKPFHIYSGECSSIVSDNEGHQTRSYRVNVRRLCMIICLTAGKYYRDNKEKFTFFNYSILDWDEEMSFMELDDKKLVAQEEMSSWLDMILQKDDMKIEHCRMMRCGQRLVTCFHLIPRIPAVISLVS